MTEISIPSMVTVPGVAAVDGHCEPSGLSSMLAATDTAQDATSQLTITAWRS